MTPIADLVDLVADGQLPRVDELDPYRLGTSPSNYGNRSNYGASDPYVPRTNHDVDQRLGGALVPGGLVVVAGPSKAGKSRTAFEVLRQRWPAAHLVAPQVGLAWDELAEHPRMRASADPLVVWLDDLDRFLTGNDPLTLARVNALTARQGPTMLLGTLRSDRLAELRDSTGELGRGTRLLLESATTIELTSTRHSEQEQDAVRAAYPAQDLDSGLGEGLAYVPQLLDKYLASRDAADQLRYLIVRCAIDWARVGIGRPIPEPDLYALVQSVARTERPDLDVTETQLVQGVQWARSSLPGAPTAALLVTHPLPNKVRGYRPFDYLVATDDGQRGQPRPIPDHYWSMVLDRATPDDVAAIGETAYTRNAIGPAIAANQKAADSGNTDAMVNLGVLLADRLDPPDLDGAQAWYRRAADAGNTDAMVNLGVLLADRLDPPDLDGAQAWYRRAADAGNTDAMVNLGVLLADRLDPPDLDGAQAWYRRAADAGNTDAMVNLGVLLADRLDPPDLDGAQAWYRRAADAGNTDAMVNLGVLLADRLDPPDLDGAQAWYRRAADAGNTDAMVNLGVLLADRLDPPDLDGAQAWYRRAADAGNTDAMVNLGVLLADRLDPPDLDGAQAWYRRAADAGNTDAMVNLGVLLADRLDPPDLDGAQAWYRRADDTRRIRSGGAKSTDRPADVNRDPTDDPFEALWLDNGRPFIDRAAFRRYLSDLMTPEAPEALVVRGPRGSGVSHTRFFVEYVLRRTGGFELAVTDLSQLSPVVDIAVLVDTFRRAAGITEEIPSVSDIPSSAHVQVLGPWLYDRLDSHKRVWIWIVDGVDRASNPLPETLIDLANSAGYWLRPIILGWPAELSNDRRALTESIEPLEEGDVRSFIAASQQRAGLKPSRKQLAEDVRGVMTDLPSDPAVRATTIARRLSAAFRNR